MLKLWGACTVAILLAGCASEWIANPSPTTRSLVNDLRLDGHECKASSRSIICTATEPELIKMPQICSSDKGCIEQPSVQVTSRFTIGQDSAGLPTIEHELIRQAVD